MDSFSASLTTWLARRKRIGKTLALIAFAAGIVAGGGLYIVIDGLYVKLTAPPPGAATMAAIGNYLALSASVRPTVQAAIANVENCSESPANAEATLQQASTTRHTILQDLRTLPVSGLPNGAQLVSAFTTAMQDSVKVDNDYQAWTADLVRQGSNTCGSNPNQDPNYVAAGTASAATIASKDAFLAIWNPIAPHYGQQTYTDTGF
jgi:hypothetical protein